MAFEHRDAVLADVRARRDAEPADEPGDEVAHDVAVQVRQHEHVVQLGLLHELHAHVVDDAVLELDVRIVPRDLAGHAEEQAVGELHDVRLVDRGDLLPAVRLRVLERELHDPAAAHLGDVLDRDRGVLTDPGVAGSFNDGAHLGELGGPEIELDAGVQVLDVLAHHDEVDVAHRRTHARIRLRRPQIRVEVELLAERDVHRAEALPELGRERTLQAHLVAVGWTRAPRAGTACRTSRSRARRSPGGPSRSRRRSPRSRGGSPRRSPDRCRRRG